MTLGFLALLALMAGAIAVGARLGEGFRVRIRAGRIADVRGRVPAVLLEQLAALAREARIERGTIRSIRDLRGPRLLVSGVPEPIAQRIRNVVGVHGR
jgi:hypothetical protein